MTESRVWSLRSVLAIMRREFPNSHHMTRAWAAEVLQAVGDKIAWGNSDSGYSPREIGWALARVFGSRDSAAFPELVQGFLEASAYEADGTLPDDLRPEMIRVGVVA